MRSSFSQLVASTLLVVGALFPIVHPLGNAPIFLVLTLGISEQGRAKLARTIASRAHGGIAFHWHPVGSA